MTELLPREKILREHNGINLIIDNSDSSFPRESDVVEGILKTMRYLADNYQVLQNDDIECYGANLGDVQTILCDTSIAYDEFLIMDSNQESITIEVVTPEVAECNDRDFLRDDEQLNDYELGKTWSYYTPLNGTEYYYRLL